ncbi:MAG: hypothetical protein ACYTHK_12995 [Planctomycetota bacterium]
MTALRWIKRLILLLVVLAVAVLFGGPVFLSSEYGRTRVEAALAKGLKRDVTIGKLDVGMMFRSLAASEVRMGHPKGFPRGNTVAVDELQIECGLQELFDGKVKGRLVGNGVDLNVLKKGERTTLDGLGGTEEEKQKGEAPPLDVEIDLENCNFTYTDLDTKETTSFEGIAVNAHLSDQPSETSGRIRVTMRELHKAPVRVKDVEVDLRADGSRFVVDTARGTMAGGGLITARGEISLDETSAWRARLDAENVSLDGSLVPVVATFWPFAAGASDQLQGLVTAGFDLNGTGVTWEAIRPSMTGQGEIRLTRLQLPKASVLGQVAHYINQGDDTLGLNDAGAQFQIAGGWVEFNRLSASGKEARYDLQGRVGLDGALDLRIDVLPLAKLFGERTHRDIAKYMDELIVNVRGTTVAPTLSLPDMEAMLKKLAADELRKQLDKTFR